MKTYLKRALALATSRRVRVVGVLVALQACRWWLLGQPADAELAAFLGLLGAWLWSESSRRHGDATILTSRRLLLSLAGQVLTILLGRAGLDLGPEVIAAVVAPLSLLVLGEGQREHAPAPPEPVAEPPVGGSA